MPNLRSIAQNDVLVNENPVVVYATDQPTFAIVFPGVTTITNDATLIMTTYRGNDDVSSTLQSGSLSVSGNVVTLKKLSGLVGGDRLHVTLQATCDGQIRTVGFDLYVKRLSGR